MKRSGVRLKLLLFALAALGTAQLATAQAQPVKAVASEENKIREATTLFYEALNTALQGNFEPLSSIWSHSPDTSDFSADGGEESGWNPIHDQIRNVARLYPNSSIHAQNVTVGGDDNMAYSVVTETIKLRSPDGAIMKFSQRATNIFRREGDAWKLLHHHADGSASGASI